MDPLYCESCGAEFKIKLNEDSEYDYQDIQFCPFCGDELLELDEDEEEIDVWDEDEE